MKTRKALFSAVAALPLAVAVVTAGTANAAPATVHAVAAVSAPAPVAGPMLHLGALEAPAPLAPEQIAAINAAAMNAENAARGAALNAGFAPAKADKIAKDAVAGAVIGAGIPLAGLALGLTVGAVFSVGLMIPVYILASPFIAASAAMNMLIWGAIGAGVGAAVGAAS